MGDTEKKSGKENTRLLSRPTGLLLALLLVLAAGILLPPFSKKREQTDPVDVYAAGHHFVIPLNYFRSKKARPSSSSIAATLQVLFPSFEPIHGDDPSIPGRLIITIENESGATLEDMSKGSDFLRVDDRVADEYKKLGMTEATYVGTSGGDHFNTADKHFYMRCTHIFSTWASAPQCSSRITVLENVKVYLRFNRSNFNDFPAIIHLTQEFLKSHEIKPERKPQ